MTWAELYELLDGNVRNRIEPAALSNIAPTMDVLVALPDEDAYVLATMPWGIQPGWARTHLINAQAGKYVAPGRSFWSQFRRCLIPASGFYEWKAARDGTKQPIYLRSADGSPFVFAGLYRTMHEPGAVAEERCVIVTTKPNVLIEPIHNRMPAILKPEHYGRWLNPALPHTAMADILQPYPSELLRAYAVSKRVNNVKNQGADLIEPVSVE